MTVSRLGKAPGPARKPSSRHTRIETWTTSFSGTEEAPELRCSSLLRARRPRARRHTQLGPELCPHKHGAMPGR